VATLGPGLLRHPPAQPGRQELVAVPVAEVRQHLDRLLMGAYPHHGLEALLQMGALEAWLPELQALVGFGDGEWRHKDLWKHSKQVVWQAVPRLPLRWSALLHDIGKVKTRRGQPDSQVRFFGHSEVGAAIFRKRIAPRLAFEGELRQRVNFLILHHLRASQYQSAWTDSAVRRFVREAGEGLQDLLDLSRADITTKRPARRDLGLNLISELEDRIIRLKLEDAKTPPLPKGIGDLIMERFELKPSRRIGEIKKRLESEVEAGRLEAGRELDYYAAWLEEHKEALLE
jgi:poly(A) polymerase